MLFKKKVEYEDEEDEKDMRKLKKWIKSLNFKITYNDPMDAFWDFWD